MKYPRQVHASVSHSAEAWTTAPEAARATTASAVSLAAVGIPLSEIFEVLVRKSLYSLLFLFLWVVTSRGKGGSEAPSFPGPDLHISQSCKAVTREKGQDQIRFRVQPALAGVAGHIAGRAKTKITPFFGG